MKQDVVADVENFEDLFSSVSLRFRTSGEMRDHLDMDEQTFYRLRSGEDTSVNIGTLQSLARIQASDFRYRFDDPDSYIKITEEDGWGTGNIKLEDGFRKFLFGRQLFEPLNEQQMQQIAGFSRAQVSNYRSEDKWIDEAGYRDLFSFYKHSDPEVSIDLRSRRGESLFEDLSLGQFTEYFLEAQQVDESRSKVSLTAEAAREYRAEFDEAVGSWGDTVEEQKVRQRLVDSKRLGVRELSARNPSESRMMDELEEYGIVENLYDDNYFVL